MQMDIEGLKPVTFYVYMHWAKHAFFFFLNDAYVDAVRGFVTLTQNERGQ